MFEEKNNQNYSYGQSDSGYGGGDTYRPTSIFDSPAKETPAQPVPPVTEPVIETEVLENSAPATEQEAPAAAEDPKPADEQPEVATEEETEAQESAQQEPKEESQETEKQEQSTHSQGDGWHFETFFGSSAHQTERTYYSPDGRPMGQQSQNQGQDQNRGEEQEPPRRTYYDVPPPQGQNLYGNLFEKKNDTFSILSLVCGIFSLLISCCGGVASILLGAFAILFAFMSKSRAIDKRMSSLAKAGVVVAVIGIIFGIFVFSIHFLPMNDLWESIADQYNQMTETTDGWLV